MDGLATKEDLLELPTKQDFKTLESKIDDIQQTVTRLDTRTDEDTGAALKDIVSLRKRVSTLERQGKLSRPINLSPFPL
jgi:hypothetical protein